MAELDPAVEQQIADMSEQDLHALLARTRQPTSSEHLKTIAAKHISEDQLPTFMAIADPKKLADENGNIDEAKVSQHLGQLFGTSEQQQPSRWGQYSAPGQPPKRPGDDGRAALEKRHNVKRGTDQPAAGAGVRPGADGRAALERRHGVKGRK